MRFVGSDWRKYLGILVLCIGLRVADQNYSNGSSTGRDHALDLTSGNSSVSSLESILNLCQATARIEREVQAKQFAGTKDGQNCAQQLKNSLTARLNSFELLEINSQRPSVITPTPPGSPRTQRASTPTAQSIPIPPNPRSCASADPLNICVPNHSPTCSEISSIGGDPFEIEEGLPDVVFDEVPYLIDTNMEQAEAIVVRKIRKFNLRIETYTHADLNAGTLQYHKSEMDNIQTIFEDLILSIDEFLDKFSSQLDSAKLAELKAKIPSFKKSFRDHRASFSTKLNELNGASLANSTASTSFQAEQLKLLKEQNEISRKAQEAAALNLSNVQNESIRILNEKKTASAKKVKAKIQAIMDDLSTLNDKTKVVEDWNAVTDLVVGRAMKENDKIVKEYSKINDLRREVDEIIAEYDLDDVDDELGLQECEIKMVEVQENVEEMIKSIKKEDNERELYSLDDAKVDKVKLPTFGGKDSEDYEKFKSDLLKGFAQNRVTKADKLSKLRECLYGEAKKLVPESIASNIDDAFRTLDNTYEDPVRLLRFRRDYFFKLGHQPKEDDKGGYKAQVEWFREIEVTMESLLALGIKDDECGKILFNKEEIRKYPTVFAPSVFKKLVTLPGVGESKFQSMINKVAEIREVTQECACAMEGALKAGIKTNSSSGNRGGQNRSPGLKGVQTPSLAMFKPPRRYEECRVCNHLSKNGDTDMLYDNHSSNFPTGCPRYIGMTIRERATVCKAAKICIKCHDPSYVFKFSDLKNKKHKCISNKSRYTCLDSNCNIHMWCCETHQSKNEESLKKFQQEIRSKHNLEFIFIAVSIPKPSKSIINSNTETATKPSLQSKSTPDPVCHQENVDKTKNLSSSQALRKLKKKLSKQGIKDELHPIPEGSAQFMLGWGKGKTRPLLHLYDTGCGSVLFKSGVPEKELYGTTLKTVGPFTVGAVGGTQVKVNNEYQCTIGLIGGKRQVLEGWTIDRVTDALPFVNLQQAEAELKGSRPENQELQEMKCHSQIGGEVDVLVGELYKRIFPVAIHSLENGLTIYKMTVTPHDPKFNAVIGGPHASFRYMAQDLGGVTILFANLSQQLENYKNYGPPKIGKVLMSCEDIRYAKEHMEWGDEIIDDYNKDFHMMTEELEEVQFPHDQIFTSNSITQASNVQIDAKESSTSVQIDTSNLSCVECGIELSQDSGKALQILMSQALSTKNDENDQMLKQLHKAQSDGLSIEYRCPRCRSCTDCRRSFETERVSLREEQEDLMIWDSVKIDWENKQIICHLPLRGKESDFLSPNRDIALRVLDQQCLKYSKDEETKASIAKAFRKLIDNGQLVFWKDLTEEEKSIIQSKDLSHYLIWRVVFKESLSTPSRPVFDGSQKTKLREDGSAGRCLNDAVVKGRVTTLNLVKMVLRFCVGKYAVQGDLKQFYASIKLVRDQWNLQRVLYRENLEIDAEVQEAVIKTLIWGIKCISAQSECAVIKLAESIKESNPRLADLLINGRFVDDCGDSHEDIEALKKLIDDADDLFSKVGLACKGWSFTGSKPPADVCEEGDMVSIGGMKWHTMTDLLEIPIPKLHFSKKVRGRLLVGTQVFEGSMVEDLNKFVPQQLTRRMIFSKKYSIFDILGKFTPIDMKLKLDMSEAVSQTQGWDDPVPPNLRNKWVNNFWLIEKLRGIRFKRAKMPLDAVNCKMGLITAGDTAEKSKITGAWARFKLKNGSYSCQNLLGRSLMANSTTPKDELDALTMTTNLNWILRQMLVNWVDEENDISISDSTIALCWVSSEKKRLSLFHRNRTVQIRRAVDLKKLYHVVTDSNPADVGTRPSLVTEEDVGPESVWEIGYPWMKGTIDDAVKNGILTPISKLRVKEEQEEDFNKGVIIEKSQEILTRGHQVLLNSRIENVKSRSEYSNYIIEPTKFKFEKSFNIVLIVLKFIRSFTVMKRRRATADIKFQMFMSIKMSDSSEIDNKMSQPRIKMNSVTPIVTTFDEKGKQVTKVFDENYVHNAVLTCSDSQEEVIDIHRVCALKIDIFALKFGAKVAGRQYKGRYHIPITDLDVSLALEYLFKKGTEEVKHFYKPDFIKKIAVEKDGILVSRSRILDCMRFQVAGGLESQESLFQFGIKSINPVLDRHSPLSYSIADYIHRLKANHGGYETCYRESLNHVFIIQGLSLFRELNEDCTKCAKLRGKCIQASMGPISDFQMTIAPAFWITMSDLMGPVHIHAPGHAMTTRNNKMNEVKAYVMVNVCPTTKNVNLQVIEGKSAEFIIDGLNRLGCEVGFPSYFLIDKDSGIMKALNEAKVSLKDMQHLLYKERRIKFKTCPVGGHNYHGAVERRIRTVEECLEKADVFKLRIFATGLQTILKLIENDMNNLPLGYMFGRDSDNSPLLKLICPNFLRTGRINTRSLDGPISIPKGPAQIMEKIEKAYLAYFKIWNAVMVPKLMKMNKWFENKGMLKVGDVVYFQKEEGDLKSIWTLGKVEEVTKSSDEVVRKVVIRYQNAKETVSRCTERAARGIIKLFHIEDTTWQDDMHEVEKLKEALETDDVAETEAKVARYVMQPVSEGKGLRYRLTAVGEYREVVALKRLQDVKRNTKAKAIQRKYLSPCQNCCCFAHCSIKCLSVIDAKEFSGQAEEVHVPSWLLDRSFNSLEEDEEEISTAGKADKNLTEMLCAVNVDLSDAAPAAALGNFFVA